MFRRNIKPLEESYCELCSSSLETDGHIFTDCPRASAIWATIGITARPTECRIPWTLGQHLLLPSSVHLDVILLILWNIWKACNATIFDSHLLSPIAVLLQVIDDMDTWRPRYQELQPDWDTWRNFLRASISSPHPCNFGLACHR
ncbi:hypothetical protein HU200_016864 [Digitaria exilis]|uniref:Reverse transcriptase zinc-binding domain-containing protein n=1 Tax=Digitaria exilis TaxID=1010633 RepID=A0A835F7I4_9POAL|nr:hypothetical protein HU200_016864 [Digitaria exilis]